MAEPRVPLGEVGVAAGGLAAFALLVHRWPGLSVAGLLAAAVALHVFFRRAEHPLATLGLARLGVWAAALSAAGAGLGVGLGALYRLHLGRGALPGSVGTFALPAALIGATEEAVYRGYVQGRLRGLGMVGAVAGAALAHAAYKCCLFALPEGGPAVGWLGFAGWTVAGGVAFGLLRELARSVLPPLLAHAAFDVVVYGALAEPPWWVWA
ncbi:MAG: CPBP family intramembrane glutamic endopeptidase [Candidatus Brocadiia bacterium]